MANKIFVEIELDQSGAVSSLKEFEGKSKRLGGKAGESFSSGFGGATSVLIGNLAAIAITKFTNAIGQEFAKIGRASKNLEVIETQFTTITGSVAAAQSQIKDLERFAATTPFRLEGLSLATRQLLSFGFAQEEIIPTLRQLGDLAAATGSNISDLTIPFGRLISTQRLSLIELDKFADRGINLFGKLSEQTGISLSKIRKAIEDQKIPFEEFEKAFNSLTREGGLFFNATNSLSQTLSGRLSTLSDNIDLVRSRFGRLFTPLFNVLLQELTKSFQDLNKSISSISVEDFNSQFLRFNDAVINFVIAPLELFGNLIDLTLSNVNTFAAGVVAGFGQIAGGVARFISFISPDSETAIALNNFKESSAEVFEEVKQSSIDSFNTLLDFPITDRLSQKNEEIRQGLDNIKNTISDKGGELGSAADSSFSLVDKAAQQSVDSINKTINGQLARVVAVGAERLGRQLIEGTKAWENWEQAIASIIGDLLINLGTALVAKGLAIDALGAALSSLSGGLAIAAGVGLIALGGVLKAGAGIGKNEVTSGASAGGITDAQPETLATAEPQPERPVTNQITVQGDVFDSEETGLRIFDIISQQSEKNGNVIIGGAFA